MLRYTYFIVVYLIFILNVQILPLYPVCIKYMQSRVPLNIQSVNIYISLVICNDKF